MRNQQYKKHSSRDSRKEGTLPFSHCRPSLVRRKYKGSEEVEEEWRRVRDSRREERVGPRRWTSAATPPEFEEQWRRREKNENGEGGGGERVKE